MLTIQLDIFLLQHLVLSQPQRISFACAPTGRALTSKGAASTASSPSSCARAAISRTTVALGASPSTGGKFNEENFILQHTGRGGTRSVSGDDWGQAEAGWLCRGDDRLWFRLRSRGSRRDPASTQKRSVQPG